MPSAPDPSPDLSPWFRQFVALVLVLFVLVAAFFILSPFLTPLTWAIVIVLATWPLYRRLTMRYPDRPSLTAALTTLGLAILFLLAIVPLTIQLSNEVVVAGEILREKLRSGEYRLDESLGQIPWIGGRLQSMVRTFRQDNDSLTSFLLEMRPRLFAAATGAAQRILRILFILLVCFFSMYFLFRHGHTLRRQLSRAAHLLGGPRFLSLIQTATATIRAGVYGTLLTAFAQGILSGIGYWIFGAPVPVLLGFATIVFSFLPFGPPLLYIPVGIGMMLTGSQWSGAAVLLWGTLIVSTADNLLRPLLISQTTQMSVITVLFGVIGGIYCFGLVGVFIGPAILALAQTLWLEFVREESLVAEEGKGVPGGS